MNNTVIFTAITGGYDEPRSQLDIEGVDFVFFTDGLGPPPQSPEWTVIDLADVGVSTDLDPRRRSKFPKLYPQQFEILTQYKYGIWIDGEMGILRRSFVPEIISFLDHGMVISPHFESRLCAYGEATIRSHPKYLNEPLEEQVAFYHQEGFPENYGLYECGVSVRDLQNPEVAEVGRLWLQQNLEWTYQDQVSLPYCFWKTGFQPDVLPQSWRNYDWINLGIHRFDDR